MGGECLVIGYQLLVMVISYQLSVNHCLLFIDYKLLPGVGWFLLPVEFV